MSIESSVLTAYLRMPHSPLLFCWLALVHFVVVAVPLLPSSSPLPPRDVLDCFLTEPTKVNSDKIPSLPLLTL